MVFRKDGENSALFCSGDDVVGGFGEVLCWLEGLLWGVREGFLMGDGRWRPRGGVVSERLYMWEPFRCYANQVNYLFERYLHFTYLVAYSHVGRHSMRRTARVPRNPTAPCLCCQEIRYLIGQARERESLNFCSSVSCCSLQRHKTSQVPQPWRFTSENPIQQQFGRIWRRMSRTKRRKRWWRITKNRCTSTMA